MASRRFQNISPPSAGNILGSLQALSEAVTYITAQSQPKIRPLPSTATQADIIAKVNEILDRLQGTP